MVDCIMLVNLNDPKLANGWVNSRHQTFSQEADAACERLLDALGAGAEGGL